MDMLRGERRTQEGQEEVLEGQTKEDVGITPLAIPMLAGPGAISTVIVLSSQARGLLELGAVYGSVVITGLVSYLVLRIGEGVLTRLGKTGIRVLTRIMGLILAAVAIQFVLSGIKEALVFDASSLVCRTPQLRLEPEPVVTQDFRSLPVLLRQREEKETHGVDI